MKLKIFFLSLIASLLFPGVVSAASFSLRLGQPKTPTNQNSFKLTFVALDTQNDRNITVRCFKQGPGEGSFTQFDTDKILIPGGNTDSCEVGSSILNTQGVYSFYVTGNAGPDSITSQTVTVEYNTSGPSAPSDYSKEKVNSCDYKIKFKTANDGKTVKVQLFRSDTVNISVGSGSVIATLNIGPNQEGQIINSVPDCNKNYYYVIRSVDASDNTSGTVGDSFTTTTVSGGTTTTSTAQSGSGNTSASGAIAGSGSTSQVSPEEDDASKSGEINSGASTTEPPTEILGATTESKKNFTKWLLLLIAVFVGYFASRVMRTKSK